MQSEERQEFAWRAGGEQLKLGEYIEFARERSLSATLELRVGPIEVGCIAIDRGQLRHAEMPGSVGDSALSFIYKLARVEVQVGALKRDLSPTLDSTSEPLLSAPQLTPRSRSALAAVFAGFINEATAKPNSADARASKDDPANASIGIALKLPTIIKQPARSHSPATPSPRKPVAPALGKTPSKPKLQDQGLGFDAFFIQAMRAYGRRDYTSAMESFKRCAVLRPSDSRVQHNIDRLRERLGNR